MTSCGRRAEDLLRALLACTLCVTRAAAGGGVGDSASSSGQGSATHCGADCGDSLFSLATERTAGQIADIPVPLVGERIAERIADIPVPQTGRTLFHDFSS